MSTTTTGIAEMASRIEELEKADIVAESAEIEARERQAALQTQIWWTRDQLSFAIPSSIEESLLIASLLMTELHGNEIDDRLHDRLERIMVNLVVGLERVVGEDADRIPSWLTLPSKFREEAPRPRGAAG